MFHMKFSVPFACFYLLCTFPFVADAKPTIFVDIMGVKEATGASCNLATEAQKAVTSELKSRPEVTLDLGLPKRREKLSRAELSKLLKERNLTGYGMVLRITKCAHQLLPPAKGKIYKVLMVEVGVAIDAEKIPSAHIALAGEGSSQVGTEVSRVKEREKQQLLREALAAATKQAVQKSITKLCGKKKKKRRSRRKRRGRR